ncbi:exopolyphosphatase / guanosine-5'-triphosphate,3'-diphosphate pyrophosphatase [Belliella buryatensis]|uniref:Exopolyphosphatase / guanosine-5'-triphosphate,3'-diphosphate pyrophosphatase n=1 Tax=Belliella buryatensis TaxID=1500549 RepID=A0A239GTG0_9BACT|nr:exopolyphosphatase [Belliella buryatensis]SNS72420.1 exopolyphosphatase / guanosine-5'-triphosphate,3'-diphosphate pyrophosphatase [Belliella buryatensis]
MISRKAAIIDMGTNTFHLLLVKLSADNFTTLYKEKIAVKIGQGGINRNIITDDAQKRAFHTLGHFKNLIDGERITEIFAFATSAVRNAGNGQDFVAEIKNRFDITVHVIDGVQEAQLIYEGIKFSGSLDQETHLMMDIGGGSVEFIIGNNQKAFWKQSFEIGGQRLLDLFHYHDPIISEEITNLNLHLENKLSDLISAIKTYHPTKLVGASGTFDTLSDMYYETIHRQKGKAEQSFILPRDGFETLAEQLLTLNKAERLKIPGMIPMRVDMIVVASCLIKYILQYVPVDSLICSSFALKEGAISQLLLNNSLVESPEIE